METIDAPCVPQEQPQAGQKRAQKGGEVGPNGDWYRAGAFIATKDIPKRTRQWMERRPIDRHVIVELSTRTSGAKLAPRVLGMVPIAPAISDVFTYGEAVNETYVGYLRSRGGGEFADQLLEWVELYKAGTRLVRIEDHPQLACVEDLVMLANAGMPISEKMLARFIPKIREHIQHIARVKAEASKPKPS